MASDMANTVLHRTRNVAKHQRGAHFVYMREFRRRYEEYCIVHNLDPVTNQLLAAGRLRRRLTIGADLPLRIFEESDDDACAGQLRTRHAAEVSLLVVQLLRLGCNKNTRTQRQG